MSNLLLNYLPLHFTSDVFHGSTLKFDNFANEFPPRDGALWTRLAELRKTHSETHLFHAVGNQIYCVPLEKTDLVIGKPTRFDIFSDFSVANAIARQALLNFFRSRSKPITRLRPVSILLDDHNLSSQRPDVFGFFPEYSFDIRPLAPDEGRITSGVLVNFSIRSQFQKTVAELIAESVPVAGLYVVHPTSARDLNPFIGHQRRYLGRIDAIRNGMAILSDSEFAEYDIEKCYLEGTPANIEAVGRALLGHRYHYFSKSLQTKTYEIMGAEHQMQRLEKLGKWLEEKSPLRCNADLSIRIRANPHHCVEGSYAGTSTSFALPYCALRPGNTIRVRWPVDRQIDQHGPFDSESFPDKRIQIAVISPRNFLGDVQEFMRQFNEGAVPSNNRSPFRQGFVRKYHLTSCDFIYQEVQLLASRSPADSYKNAALELLAKHNPHVAMVVIRNKHRDMIDKENPYYSTKASLMAQGVPVQMVKIDTVRRRNKSYILNNLALATYAKLGGIPWTLTSAKDLVHEIVVGIGSARLNKSRRNRDEQVIGITTVFSGDGQYLLANSTHEVSSKDYLSALTELLSQTVSHLRSRYGWKSGDRVRFIFHQSFKKYKNVEARAVREFTESLGDFQVSYAFVHVSTSHNWMLYDPTEEGVGMGDRTKGLMVPKRGQTVPLGPHTALLTLCGPYQLKTHLQGCPCPILINVHERSTFKDLNYITRQIFNLSFMSWRGFNPSKLPVSIDYSNMIVDLLGHLRNLRNWNPETLNTALRERRWFL